MNIIKNKLKEVFLSVLPINIIVLIISLFISPLSTSILMKFFLGSVCVVLGLTIFLFGIDLGITPLGMMTGTSLAKTNKLWFVLLVGLILGFFISIAEPGLLVLANQVDAVTAGQISNISILIVVSIGLALLLAFGFYRIFYNIPLFKILLVLYGIIFMLSFFTSKEFLAISFDASGSTTGILAVPFILSLSVGISKLKKDSKASEKDSFGLVAIASTGAIISVMLLDIFSSADTFAATLETQVAQSRFFLEPFVNGLSRNLLDAFIAVLPLMVILIIAQHVSFHLNKRELRRMVTGFIFALVGLFLFLVGVNAGFMDVGAILGNDLALLDHKGYILVVGFLLGVVTILAEPAVYVLTHQIEEVTSGYIKRITVLIPLAIGVGIAVALSVLRVLVPQIQLWHYLLPGYIISLGLMFVIPKLFVGIAFDAGGVATGPVTATFILAFIQGAAHAFEGADLMIDGFGMIAMVAMMPIVTLEILGLSFELKKKRKGVSEADVKS